MPIVRADEFRLPAPGVMVHLSPPLDPPILKGIKIHPDNPFRFDFILDPGGDSQLSNNALKDQSSRLIKYFLASLTIPEKDLWVNLSPYEKDRIIPQSLGLTEMGRDLLAEDYMLKQITASLIYPEDNIGKKFWKRVYEEASKEYGTTNIPVDTFNKVWIVPDKAVVYENAKAGTAYVVESSLKVMLEQDYLALQKHAPVHNAMGSIGANIVREIVIPELTKEVNENENFAKLRQVYNSLILSTWYKEKIKNSILAQVYTDKNKVAGVSNDDPRETQKIYGRYLQAFKRGVYNYIKEEQDFVTQQMIPRKYFSGGFSAAMLHIDQAQTIPGVNLKNYLDIDAAMVTPVEVLSKFERAIEAHLTGAMERNQRALLDYSVGDGDEEKLKMIKYIVDRKKLPYQEITPEYLESAASSSHFQREEGDIVYIAPAKMELDAGQVKQVLNSIGLHDRRTFSTIAGISAAQEKSFEYPELDPLTDLPNRRGYLSLFTHEIKKENREEGIHMMVVAMDLDRFKEINDLFGHKSGDEILIKIADTIRKRIRSTDIFARLGGDEFVLVFPITPPSRDAQFIKDLGEKILSEIQKKVYLGRDYILKMLKGDSPESNAGIYDSFIYQLAIQNDESSEDLKVRFPTLGTAIQGVEDGVCQFKGWVPQASMGASKLEIPGGLELTDQMISALSAVTLDKADEFLYKAKSKGRNRIEIRPDEERVWSNGDWYWNAHTSYQDIIYFKNILFESMQKEAAIKPYLTTIALIKELAKQHYRMGVGSSSRRAETYLRTFGIDQYFKGAVVDGNMVIRGDVPGKPSKEFFRVVARKANVAPEDTVVFESTIAGVRSAKEGGFGLIIALSRNNDVEDLRLAGADHVLPDIGDLSIDRMQDWFIAKQSRRFEGAIFDVDGVISDTHTQHFDSWKLAMDGFLDYYGNITKQRYDPFVQEDNAKYFSGKTTTSVMINFLASRGIVLRSQNVSKAMISRSQLYRREGGINFNSDKMNLQVQNNGGDIQFHLDSAMLQQLQNAPGFVPVIINIHPMTDLKTFLGFKG